MERAGTTGLGSAKKRGGGRAVTAYAEQPPRAVHRAYRSQAALYHIAIEEATDWAYTGASLVPLKGFSGVVWQRAQHEGMF